MSQEELKELPMKEERKEAMDTPVWNEIYELVENISGKKLRDIFNVMKEYLEKSLGLMKSKYESLKQEKVLHMKEVNESLSNVGDQITKIENLKQKAEQSLEQLESRTQGLEGEMQHIQEEIKQKTNDIEDGTDTQKSHEDELAFNRMTLMKLLQSFDAGFLSHINGYVSDPIVKDSMELFTGLLFKKPLGSESEMKQVFGDIKLLKEKMQNSDIEELTSELEKQYLDKQSEINQRCSLMIGDKVDIEKKQLVGKLLHYLVFVVGVSAGKRNLSKAVGRLEKMQNDLISKKAEFAKKEISKIDPILLEKYKEAVGSYAKMLELLKKQRELLEEDKKKVKCELEELHLQFFKSLKEGATEEEINRICGMPGDQNDLEDVSIHEEDEEPHAAKVTEN